MDALCKLLAPGVRTINVANSSPRRLFKPRVYVAPSRDLVIVRVGGNSQGRIETALPNAVRKGITTDGDKADPATPFR